MFVNEKKSFNSTLYETCDKPFQPNLSIVSDSAQDSPRNFCFISGSDSGLTFFPERYRL